MSIFLLLIYFFGLYIRPQDWMHAVQGWPLDWVIYAVLAVLMPLESEHISRLGKSRALTLLGAWILVIAASNLVHFEFWWARTSLQLYVPYLVTFASLLVFISTPKRLRVVIWFVLLLTAILAVQCIDMMRTGIGWAGQSLGWNDGFGGRAQWVGLWDGPNVLCLLFVVAIPFLFEFLFKPWSWIVRIIAASFFVLTIQAMLLTQSRGGFMALIVSLLMASLVRFQRKKVIVPLVVCGALLLVVAPARMGELDDRDGSKSAYYRSEMWSASLTMARQNPVFGVGKTRFRDYSKELTGKSLIGHNSFAENLGETGVVGLWVFIGLIYVALKGLWRVKAKLTDVKELSMARALLVSVVAYAATSLFLTTDFDLFYVQLGLVAAFCATHDEYPTVTFRDACYIAMLAVLFVVGLFVFLQLYV